MEQKPLTGMLRCVGHSLLRFDREIQRLMG